MAGEWAAIDCNLATKPEVLELVDETGEPADAVIGRMVQLWLWAAMNSEDGTARMTVRRLGKLFGGSDTFWTCVQRVGWLQVDEENGTVAIPGWERRFSSAAKTRAQAAVRHARERDGRSRAHGAARERPQGGRETVGEERRREDKFPTPREAWQAIREAWGTAGNLKPWKPDRPPDGGETLLETPGWAGDALEAIARLPSCRFFKTPPTMVQLFSAGFVDKVLAGTFDHQKQERGQADEKPTAKAWSKEERLALEHTRKTLEARKEAMQQ